LNTPTLQFELAGTPAGSNDKITMLGGVLAMSGAQTYQFTLTEGQLTPGTYPLIDGGINTSASSVSMVHNLPLDARQSFQLQRPAAGNGQCYVNLLVTGNPTTLVWRGLADSNWDATTTNWLNGASPDRFYNFDTVVFDDTSAAVPLINLPAAVNPASITVSAATGRTFSGAGALTGSGPLTKSGAGTLTILTTNSSFNGHVALTGGAITLGAGASLNTGNLTLSGGSTFNFPPSTPAYFYGGTITVLASQSGTIYSPGLGNGVNGNLVSGNNNSVLYLSSGVSFGGTTASQFDGFTGTINILPGATLRFSANSSGNTFGSLNPTFVINGTLQPRNAGNTVRLGALSGTGSITGPQSNAGSGNTTYLIGGNNLDVTFNGVISSNTAVPGSLVVLNKIGTGKLILGGTSTFTGGTTVEAGALIVTNPTGSGSGTGDLAIAGGATLGGTGFIGSPTTLADFAILAPGNSTGTLTFNDDLTLGEFSVLNFELGTTSDAVVANGALTLAGTLNVIPVTGFGPGTYTLFTYNPVNTFNFSSLTLGTVPGGYNYAINTSTPGQVKLIVSLPTPPTFGGITVSGGNLILSGSNGVPNASYYVLSSTNITQPTANWSRIATNQFDANGAFTVTNPVNPALPQLFYRLQLP
jgi:autotransporter-associated beta strand protein